MITHNQLALLYTMETYCLEHYHICIYINPFTCDEASDHKLDVLLHSTTKFTLL